MRQAVLLFLLAASGLTARVAWGQTFERFGVREGLPSELIGDVEVGPDGLLWIGTDDGLARYDGHSIRVWQHRADDPTTLPSSRVAAVLPVEGAVWVGTTEGLARLDLTTGESEPVQGLPPSGIQDIVEDAEGRLWVGYTNRGLWRFSPRTGEAQAVPFGMSPRYRVIVIATDGDDVWAEVLPQGAPPVVCRLDTERAVCLDARPAEPWRLFEDGGQAVLAHRDALDPEAPSWVDWIETGERWPMAPTGAFRSVVRVGPDEAWFRATAMLTVLRSDGSERVLPAAPQRRGGLGGFDNRAFARDRPGNAWVGTAGGLYLARGGARAFEAVQRDPADPTSLGDERVNGMAQDAEGRLWIATNGGLFRLNLASGQVEALPAVRPGGGEPATARAFWQVLPRGGDRALVSLKRGSVGLWDGRRLQPVDGARFSAVRDLAETPDGDVWAAWGGGLWRLRDDGPPVQEALPASAGRPINVVETDGAGRTWIGTDEGVSRREGGVWRPVAEGSLCAPIVWSMTETPADPGAMWVATVGGGLARIDADDRVTCVTDRDGLPTNSVYGVLADGDGRLWASTTSGLARVDPLTREVVTFSSADGLAGDAFNLMAQLRLRDGRLAFGGPDGLTIVDPEAVEARAPPAVVITGVERQGRLLRGLPEALELAHDAGAFGVRFAAVDFRAPQRNRYQYRLVGLDDDWQTTDGSAPRAAYVGVPPGRYRFEVRGAAGDTPFSEAAALDVVVVPAVWQRLWFRLGAGVLLLGAVAAGGLTVWVRRREAAARERAEAVEIRRRLAEARERERVRLARDLHDGPVQTLYRVGHDLDRLGEGDGGVGPVRARVGDVAGELRQILTDLRPTLVDHLGLGAALRSAGRRTEERFPDLTVAVEDRAQGQASEAGRLALFRIAQEALQNAGRHAGPARVTLTLEDMAEGVLLTVRDDGRGFALPDRMVSLARTEHFGLVGAQERAEAAGGTFEVRAKPGAGTAILAWVPGPEAAERPGREARKLDP
ncbi:MAG: two-component regulator propeller domain-containing protein [Bacteroidota bacterium]